VTAAIETEGLTKYYGKHRGLEGLDLTVEQGEVFGYLGPNGSGKTTTIRMLLDVIRPTGGRARVLGMDPRTQGPDVRRRIGYLQGELIFEGRETAAELLGFLGQIRGGVSRRDIAELARRLDVDLNRPVLKLSTGNKRKVGLIQAFMHKPDLLILDEPTAGLDPLMQQEFLAMVREAQQAGQTVFMSSHVLAEVQAAADRVGIVRNGRLVAVEGVESLRQRAVRQVEVTFAEPVKADDYRGLPGVRDVTVDGTVLRCTVDGKLDALVKAIAAETVTDLISTEPDLEEIFLAFYAEGDQS
jgi:ABC-2 type transport system ATP-binding protein